MGMETSEHMSMREHMSYTHTHQTLSLASHCTTHISAMRWAAGERLNIKIITKKFEGQTVVEEADGYSALWR